MEETRDPNLITLYQLNSRLIKCQIEADEQARKARAAKQAVDAAASELSEHITRMNEHLPLFDKPAEPAVPESEPEGQPVEKDDWKQVPLRSLAGLTANMIEKLEAADILTVGDVGEFSENHNGLGSIKGFGPKKIEILEQSLDQFWDEWNRLHPGVKSSDASPNSKVTEPSELSRLIPTWAQPKSDGQVAEPSESVTRSAEPWETVILRNYLSAKLADLISQETDGNCQTFGDLAEHLRDGWTLSDFAPDHEDSLRKSIEKFRHDQEWNDNIFWPIGIPVAWLKIEA